jgi:hypothetical protein
MMTPNDMLRALVTHGRALAAAGLIADSLALIGRAEMIARRYGAYSSADRIAALANDIEYDRTCAAPAPAPAPMNPDFIRLISAAFPGFTDEGLALLSGLTVDRVRALTGRASPDMELYELTAADYGPAA